MSCYEEHREDIPSTFSLAGEGKEENFAISSDVYQSDTDTAPDDEDSIPGMYTFSLADLATQDPYEADTRNSDNSDTHILTGAALSNASTTMPPLSDQSAAFDVPILTGSTKVDPDVIARFCQRMRGETYAQYGNRLLRSLQDGRGLLIHKDIHLSKKNAEFCARLVHFSQAVWSIDALTLESGDVWGVLGRGREADEYQLKKYKWDDLRSESDRWSASSGSCGMQRKVDRHTAKAMTNLAEGGLERDRNVKNALLATCSARYRANQRAQMTEEERNQLLARKVQAQRQRQANESLEVREARRIRQNERNAAKRALGRPVLDEA